MSDEAPVPPQPVSVAVAVPQPEPAVDAPQLEAQTGVGNLSRKNLLLALALFGGGALAGIVGGVAFYFLTYYFFGPIIGGMGYGGGWVVSGAFGITALSPIIAWSILLLGVLVCIGLIHRTEKLTWKGAVWVIFMLLCGFTPLLIGFTYSSMGWEYGDAARRWIAYTEAVVVGLWFFTMIVLRINPDEDLPKAAGAASDPAAQGTPLDKRLTKLAISFAVVGAIPFAVLGFEDEGLPGLIAGGVAGAAVVGIVAGFICALIKWVVSDDGSAKPGAEGAPKLPAITRTAPWMVAQNILTIGFLILICHEAYWYLNWFSTVQTLNVSYVISTSVKNGDSREKIQEELQTKPDRWVLATLTARPLRWCLTEDTALSNQATLDVVDIVNGQQPRRFRLLDDHKLIKLGVQVLLENSDTVLGNTSSSINQSMQVRGPFYLKKAWTYQLYEWLSERREKFTKEQASATAKSKGQSSSTEKAAVEAVLKEVRAPGSRGGGAAKAAGAMRAIDLRNCPPRFQEAYRRHIPPWERNDSATIRATFGEVKGVF